MTFHSDHGCQASKRTIKNMRFILNFQNQYNTLLLEQIKLLIIH